jgi:undecaprenyl-diphosphatase
MNWFDTVILGIVEGVTEFLPISSTGHLILAQHLLGALGQDYETFIIVVQLGAILAVVWLYADRFRQLLAFRSTADHTEDNPPIVSSFNGVRGLTMLMVTSIPAAFLGLLLDDVIENRLGNPESVAMALGVGGVAILAIERWFHRHPATYSLDQLSMRQALIIGLFQCFSLWPGMSRAAATIIGGLFSGLDRRSAAEYSFIAAVPIIVGASLYKLLKNLQHLDAGDLWLFALGFAVAFIFAVWAIKGFIRLLQQWTLSAFGVYRIGLAALVLWLM